MKREAEIVVLAVMAESRNYELLLLSAIGKMTVVCLYIRECLYSMMCLLHGREIFTIMAP